MSVTTRAPKCSLCGADLVPNTHFCRRCGSVITETPGSEQPTAILSAVDNATTQPLRSRVTTPAVASGARTSSRRSLLIGVAILLVLIGAIGVVQLMRLWGQPQAADAGSLMYPGARTVLDIKEKDSARTLHLQTSDPLEKVESWYQSNLKLTKTTRLTITSYVMKADKYVITLVVEDGTTNILIKQTP